MINKELKEKIIAYNKRIQEKSEKTSDMEILISALSKLPYGQLKKVLSDEVLTVLKKYGFED